MRELGRARVVDLSMSIADHFRWRTDLEVVASFGRGDPFHTSRFTMSCHSFTHADAPAHVDPEGATVEDVDVRQWIGQAAVVDLSGCGPDHAIGDQDLEAAGAHVAAGDIALLKTCWDRCRPISSPEYWSMAPYVTRPAAQWLLRRGVRCVGFDFPQDHAIRRLVAGERPTPAEFTTHDVLLRAGVGLLEYLGGLYQLTAPNVFLVAAPIKLAGADGGPTRAVAFELPPDQAAPADDGK